MFWLCGDVPGDSERDFTERWQEFLKKWRAWYCILPLRCYIALPLTGSQCIRGLILLWHSPSEFHQGSLRFLYLLQQEIWPLTFITSLFSLNTNLSLYTQSHVFFTVSPFLCPPPGLQAHWSRAAFHTCAARCARHILVSKQELRLAVAKSNHSCSTISCRVGVASVYWFIPGCR